MASYQMRNRATLGGNLCNASPCADMSPAVLVLEGQVVLFSGGRAGCTCGSSSLSDRVGRS